MAEFRLPAHSRPVKGITHPPPAGARELRTVRIYRFNPDATDNPRIDTFALDTQSCGPMVLDALIQLKAPWTPRSRFAAPAARASAARAP